VVAFLEAHGASFFDEIAQGSRLLGAELEDALAELVARGRIHCDSFAGLRALLAPAARRAATGRHRRRPLFGIEDAGRWTVLRPDRPADAPADARSPEAVEHLAHVLLRRYGVVCWRLIEREAAWLPPWRELVRVYRRLEARGEIRGGRFIAGVSGEQYALPDAVAAMRRVRREPHDGRMVVLAAVDPANLLGTILPGARVPRVAGARVLVRDGLVVGTCVAGQITLAEPLEPDARRTATRLLALDPGVRFLEADTTLERVGIGSAS